MPFDHRKKEYSRYQSYNQSPIQLPFHRGHNKDIHNLRIQLKLQVRYQDPARGYAEAFLLLLPRDTYFAAAHCQK